MVLLVKWWRTVWENDETDKREEDVVGSEVDKVESEEDDRVCAKGNEEEDGKDEGDEDDVKTSVLLRKVKNCLIIFLL